MQDSGRDDDKLPVRDDEISRLATAAGDGVDGHEDEAEKPSATFEELEAVDKKKSSGGASESAGNDSKAKATKGAKIAPAAAAAASGPSHGKPKAVGKKSVASMFLASVEASQVRAHDAPREARKGGSANRKEKMACSDDQPFASILNPKISGALDGTHRTTRDARANAMNTSNYSGTGSDAKVKAREAAEAAKIRSSSTNTSPEVIREDANKEMTSNSSGQRRTPRAPQAAAPSAPCSASVNVHSAYVREHYGDLAASSRPEVVSVGSHSHSSLDSRGGICGSVGSGGSGDGGQPRAAGSSSVLRLSGRTPEERMQEKIRQSNSGRAMSPSFGHSAAASPEELVQEKIRQSNSRSMGPSFGHSTASGAAEGSGGADPAPLPLAPRADGGRRRDAHGAGGGDSSMSKKVAFSGAKSLPRPHPEAYGEACGECKFQDEDAEEGSPSNPEGTCADAKAKEAAAAANYPEVRRNVSTPGAFAVAGSTEGSVPVPPHTRDSFCSHDSGLVSATTKVTVERSFSVPKVIAHLVKDEEDPSEPQVIHAIAKKDSFLELLRHDRRTRIVTGAVVLAILGLGVTLGVTLSRPPPPPPEQEKATVRYMPLGSNLDGPDRTFEYGQGEYSKFGSSVSMSRNGTRVAIGAPEYSSSDGERLRGLVQVYEERDDDWTLLEPSILGDSYGEMTGSSVALSMDGNTVAVGSPEYTDRAMAGPALAGQVKVYTRVDDSWKQLGRTIVGEADHDRLGSSVGISEDGRRVAISIPGNERGADERTKVFEFANDKWVQLGDDLIGRFGGSPISMSADGNTVAMGSLSMAENNNMGAVRVYKFASGRWGLMGSDIMLKGAEGSYDTNWTPSISSDGKTVAIGSGVKNPDLSIIGEEYDLLVRVFRLNEDTGDWVQLGDTLHDKKGPHLIAYVASISADSKVLTIGDPGGFAMGINSGHSHVLRFIDDNWVHIDKELDGFDAADHFGHSVSVSADGSRVAVGAPKSRAPGQELGRVTVYALKELTS